jgi:hypothetical protein
MLLDGRNSAFGNRFCWASHSPLTPALSPGERGKPGPVLGRSRTAGFVDQRTTIHPLLGERAGVRGNGTLAMQQVLKSGFAPLFDPKQA